VVSGPVCLAHGSISLVRTRRLPLVSPVAATLSDVDLDVADHPLDCGDYPHVRPMALEQSYGCVGIASRLGNGS
jgi:hypothetical protein